MEIILSLKELFLIGSTFIAIGVSLGGFYYQQQRLRELIEQSDETTNKVNAILVDIAKNTSSIEDLKKSK